MHVAKQEPKVPACPTEGWLSNGRQVLHVNFGGSVARDPYFSFRFKGGKPGDKVVISWVDTENDTRTDEAVIA